MYKKISVFTLFISMIFLFSACTSNTNSKYSSSIGDRLDDKPMLVASIPQEFMCFGKIYIDNNEEIETLGSGTMIGYLVNENELDFWKSKDNNNNLVYATGNDVFRKTDEGQENLKDRYELYSLDETYDCLAIKEYTGKFKLYSKQ